MTVQVPKPWEALGISESTYYRRKKSGKIPPEAIPAPVKKTVKLSKTVKNDSGRDSPILKGEKKDTRIKPGQVLNPAGRPKGSRSKLTEAFIGAMCQDFQDHGTKVIELCRASKPEAYLTIMSRIIPQQHEVGEAGAFDGMAEEELEVLITKANARIASLQVVGHA
jgi:hypothetical protein